jgi:DNA-binding beta-propeller fold protein YncE
MKVKQFFSLFFAALWLLSSCNKSTDSPKSGSDYSKGVFVVNEGPFGGSGTISWYNPATGEVQDSIYEKANNGARLGQFVQSLSFHNGKGYIVVNGANRIVVVDPETFTYLDTIGGLALPRYFLPISNDIAYVSQWGADGVTGSVARIDLNTNKVVNTTLVGSGPEKMVFLEQSRYLFVANSGGYGVDSTVASIAVDNNDQLVSRHVIPGQKNPCCLTVHSQSGFNPWYVMCKGYWNDTSEGWLGLGFINPITGISVPKGSDDLVVTASAYYFTSGTAIYSNVNGAMTKLFDQPAYGLNVEPSTGNLFCADAKDFSSAGEVVVRKTDGTVVRSFRAGVAPGEIVFVE